MEIVVGGAYRFKRSSKRGPSIFKGGEVVKLLYMLDGQAYMAKGERSRGVVYSEELKPTLLEENV
ncbi:hypothetical protein [Salinivibrio phage CW02]|uniref:Uncharacterized protein n=1 Tax=Salinivibrio phage CW02 TaxID=1161935 RepID=H9D1C8_9CAUD|nr:hypothetical protein F490_gp67 [Salinivibrio phage CW02]AFE86170.1 hypothetical protein [Salinivibrio phage CW02]